MKKFNPQVFVSEGMTGASLCAIAPSPSLKDIGRGALAAVASAAVFMLAPDLAMATEAALRADTSAFSTAAEEVYDFVDSLGVRVLLALVAGGLGATAILRGPNAVTVGGAIGAAGAATWAPDIMLGMAGTVLLP